MDLLVLNSSLTLLFVILLTAHFILQRRRCAQVSVKLPPGPWRLPIIGNIHQLVGGLPHHILRNLSKRYGPLMLLQLGEVSNLVVSSPECAHEIMKTHDISFATRPTILAIKISSYGNKGLVFAPYGDYWRQLRKISIMELLSTKRVQSFQFIREEEALNLVQSITSMCHDNTPIMNVSKKLFTLMNNITVRSVIGDKCEDADIFLEALAEGIKVSSGFNLVDLFPSSSIVNFFAGVAAKIEKYHHRVDRVLEGIIQKRMEETKNRTIPDVEENLLDVLLRIQAQDSLSFPLDTESIKALVKDLFGAGSETAATTIDWALSELVRNPDSMKKAQAEVREMMGAKRMVTEDEMNKLKYMKLVIKETLRLHPPVPLLVPRECRETCQVLGYTIPEKTRVVINAWALGRDASVWDQPEEFKPERFEGHGAYVDFKGTNFEFIPFGAGRRICPGMSFGLANVEIALTSLLLYFNWEMPNGAEPTKLDMTEAVGITARRKQELFLAAVPYYFHFIRPSSFCSYMYLLPNGYYVVKINLNYLFL